MDAAHSVNAEVICGRGQGEVARMTALGSLQTSGGRCPCNLTSRMNRTEWKGGTYSRRCQLDACKIIANVPSRLI